MIFEKCLKSRNVHKHFFLLRHQKIAIATNITKVKIIDEYIYK